MIKISSKLTAYSAVVALMVNFAAKAVEVDDLYQTKILVASQSASDRNAAQKSAFKEVIIKLSGSEAYKINEQLKSALKNPSAYLNQYSYAQEGTESFLLASFEQDKINALLQRSEVGLWGKHRPLSTVWLIDEQGSERKIISDSSTSNVKVIMQQQAKVRGIPINFPLMDLTDSMQVNMADVWGRFDDNLTLASERYLAESVFIMRISNSTLVESRNCGANCTESSYALDWSYSIQGDTYQQQYTGKSKENLIRQAVNDLADTLHKNFSYTFNQTGENFIDIEIANVTNLQNFTQISEFFTGMTLVDDVKLIEVSGEKMIFRLNVITNVDAIKQALKLEQNLIGNNDPLAENSVNQTMSFIWKG
ncbi:DUF2066 domain-containing protein [Colwelliaceae bacterium BS250]